VPRTSPAHAASTTECHPGSPSGWQERSRHPNGVGDAEDGHDSALDEAVDRGPRHTESGRDFTNSQERTRIVLHH
jgi:hypothetical protein